MANELHQPGSDRSLIGGDWLQTPKKRTSQPEPPTAPTAPPVEAVEAEEMVTAPKSPRLIGMEMDIYSQFTDLCNVHGVTPTALVEAFLLTVPDDLIPAVIDCAKVRRSLRVKSWKAKKILTELKNLQLD